MTNGKVLVLYMTLPDMMKSGHRMACEDIECDEGGIIGDLNYEASKEHVMLLTSKKSYDLIEEAELVVDHGVLLESILVDMDVYHLNKGSVIEVGDVLLEVTGPCEAYGYLSALSPELPDVLRGNRGLFVKPMDYGRIAIGDDVTIIKAV